MSASTCWGSKHEKKVIQVLRLLDIDFPYCLAVVELFLFLS